MAKSPPPTPLPQEDPRLPPLGILIADDDGSRLQCHICGRFYPSLGRHVVKAHHMTGDAYRERYGLNRKTSLGSPALQAKFRALFSAHLDAIRPAIPPGAGVERTLRQANASAPRRLQARLVASATRRRSLSARPSPPRPGPRVRTAQDRRQQTHRARQVADRLRRDPAWHARWSAALRRVRSRLTSADARDILALKGQVSQREAARRYGTAPKTVRAIWEGERRPEEYRV
jgi:hypothetical protein